MRKKPRLRRLLALAFSPLLAALFFITPASADPWPTDCDWGISGLNSTFAKCRGGSGTYRAIATCPGGGHAYGTWEPAGNYPGQSTAYCSGRPTAASIGLRQ